MRAKMILIKELFLIIGAVLFHEMGDSLSVSMTAHIFHKISIYFRLAIFIIVISNKSPRHNRILTDIHIGSSGRVIQPHKILIIRHFLLNPIKGLFSIQIHLIGIFGNLNETLDFLDKQMNVFLNKIK
jgi:hypothetical protein